MFGITYTVTKAADTEAAYLYALVLMVGNAARWMNGIDIQDNALGSCPEFEKLFINQYTPLDDKNIARDILFELWQYGLV